MEPVAAQPRCKLKGAVLALIERASLAGTRALGKAALTLDSCPSHLPLVMTFNFPISSPRKSWWELVVFADI